MGKNKAKQDTFDKLIKWLFDAEKSTSETTYREVSNEDLEFYAGRQDSPDVVMSLQRQNRPVLVYNEIKPKVDMLFGMATQVQFDATVKPVGPEDEPLAELMNGVLLHYREKLSMSIKELECFDQMIKAGRCLLYFYIGQENPFSPEIKTSVIKGNRFYLDPDCESYDLSDARYVFIDKWLTEEEIKVRWPSYDKAAMADNPVDYPVFFNEANDKHRVVECWWRELSKVAWYQDPLSGKMEWCLASKLKETQEKLQEQMATKLQQDQQMAMEASGGMEVPPASGAPEIDIISNHATAYKNVINYAIISGDGVLETKARPYPFDMFPFVLFGAYKDDNYNNYFGAISMMKDPQKGVNTMRRQLQHLLHTSPKGILVHEVGTLLNEDEYDARSSEPNFRLVVDRGSIDRFRFTDQPQISPIYTQLDSTFTQGMKDVSGAQDSLMGVQTSSREPGVTVRSRQQTGSAVLQRVFSNYSISRITAGKLLLNFVQTFVSEQEVIRIQGENGQMLINVNSQMNPQLPGWNDLSAGTFDLVMDKSSSAVSMRDKTAEQLIEFAHNNPGVIPPDILLSYTDITWSEQQKIRQAWMMQQQQQAQAQAQAQAQPQQQKD